MTNVRITEGLTTLNQMTGERCKVFKKSRNFGARNTLNLISQKLICPRSQKFSTFDETMAKLLILCNSKPLILFNRNASAHLLRSEEREMKGVVSRRKARRKFLGVLRDV